jgi:hypothetical protein
MTELTKKSEVNLLRIFFKELVFFFTSIPTLGNLDPHKIQYYEA